MTPERKEVEQTAMRELIKVLEREISFVGHLHDTKEDKTVASYLRTVIDEINNRYLQKERDQIERAYKIGGKEFADFDFTSMEMDREASAYFTTTYSQQ